MAQTTPVILPDGICVDGWDDAQRGRVRWRTLFSGDLTPTEGLTAGVAEIEPGDALKVHRHLPAELYYILAGAGVVTIGEEAWVAPAGTAVYIPGNALHGIRNEGDTLLRFFYAFAVDSFADVEYVF